MALEIPQRGLLEWAREIIEECSISRETRRSSIANWKSYYWTGTENGLQAMYNRCYSHVDRLSSYLFSPTDVRFMLEFDESEPQAIHDMGDAATRLVNREYHSHDLDLSFGTCVNWALVKGSMLHKKIWGHNGIEGWCVHPERFGVLREDISDLDRQEAFVETNFLTKSAFERTISEHPDRAEIMKDIDIDDRSNEDEFNNQDYFHQVIVGGLNPVSTSSSTGAGQVGVIGVPQPIVDPKVITQLVRVDELWVMDKKRQDYTTIRMVNGSAITEGKNKHRNLCGLYDMNGVGAEQYIGYHPYTKVCPNEVDGYFWGSSEIAQIYRLQDDLNDQIADLRRLTRLKADPPRATIGFTGMTQEKYKTLKRPGGFASEENPNAKIETLAPEIPPELFTRIEKTLEWFDDVAGFMPIMQGQGEQGVRAGVHAQTLARNASPRMRDRALLVERQLVEDVMFCLKMWQAKEKGGEVINTANKGQFMLSQLPDNARVSVDSHTSSPAFSEDNRALVFNLARLGAIDAVDTIMLTHPAHEDRLVMRAKEREAAAAQFAKEHPDLAFKGKGGKKTTR